MFDLRVLATLRQHISSFSSAQELFNATYLKFSQPWYGSVLKVSEIGLGMVQWRLGIPCKKSMQLK